MLCNLKNKLDLFLMSGTSWHLKNKFILSIIIGKNLFKYSQFWRLSTGNWLGMRFSLVGPTKAEGLQFIYVQLKVSFVEQKLPHC